jgi:hypothetical protein
VKHLREEHPPEAGVRVVYADLDGTILGPGGSLFAGAGGGTTLAAAEALAELHVTGISLVVMSGRNVEELAEPARVLGASAFFAELGAVLVEGRPPGRTIVPNFGGFAGNGSPARAIHRCGAAGFLLERYPGRLAPMSHKTEATVMFRGLVDAAEATRALAGAGYGWLELHDNGRLRRRYTDLDLEEVRVYHLLPRGVSKASAVRAHRERHAIQRHEAVAVGDSPADLEVAGEVGAFFVVANGLGSVADVEPWPVNAYVTEAERGVGFAEAVRFVLGRLPLPRDPADT